MGKNGVTINDVAKRGGVSKVTVSYVLNGHETRVRISDETRDRVLEAARELGYHPNALARGLARRQTDTFALVMQYPSVFSGWSGFINELMHGATDRCSTLGYDLILHTKVQPDLAHDVAALTDGRADGVLLLRDRDDPMAGMLAARGFPFVQFFSSSDAEGVCFVDCDNVAGAALAVQHLWGFGHRRIGHLAGSPHSVAAADRLRGYREALQSHGCRPRLEWEVEAPAPGAGAAEFAAMMSRAEAPTALFAWSDDVAVWAMRFLRDELGRRVPADVSVVGFDGTEVGEHTTPRLTCVRQPIYEMAARSVEMLADIAARRAPAQRQVVFAPELIPRDSCAEPGAHS